MTTCRLQYGYKLEENAVLNRQAVDEYVNQGILSCQTYYGEHVRAMVGESYGG